MKYVSSSNQQRGTHSAVRRVVRAQNVLNGRRGQPLATLRGREKFRIKMEAPCCSFPRCAREAKAGLPIFHSLSARSELKLSEVADQDRRRPVSGNKIPILLFGAFAASLAAQTRTIPSITPDAG
jgi:hypothetical protein